MAGWFSDKMGSYFLVCALEVIRACEQLILRMLVSNYYQ